MSDVQPALTAIHVALGCLTVLAALEAYALWLLTREFLRRERDWAVERDDLTRRLAPGYRWWTQPQSETVTERVIDPTEDDQMAAEWAPSNA